MKNSSWLEPRVERLPWSGCWIWLGALHRKGYGWARDPMLARSDMAHRVSWRVTYGSIPNGLQVLHRCDVRPCVNPTHLFLGTHMDNMRDREAKGRNKVTRGEASHFAKLTAVDVLAIRAAHRITGCSYVAIARQFGITGRHVSNIVLKRKWAHI